MKVGIGIKGLLGAGVMVVGVILARGAFAADDETLTGGVKEKGVVHNIAEDREVEQVGGIYQPEGLDKYLKRKFDKLNEKVDGLEEKIAGLGERMDQIHADLQAVKKNSGNAAKT